MNIKDIIRKDLLELQPYSSARNEFEGNARIFLDANENPYGASFRGVTHLNRYPDPMQKELKSRIAELTNTGTANIIVGNGSDELLDLAVRATTVPGGSNAIIVPPTYGMYSVAAATNNVKIKEVLPDENFNIDADKILEAADQNTRIVFVCSPNNPTGNLAPEEEVTKLAGQFKGLVIVDEAYIDFANNKGMAHLPQQYENVFVMRTFSKARGMAGARLGFGFGHPELIKVLNAIKMPYNVNNLTLEAGLSALDRTGIYRSQTERIIHSRELLSAYLQKIKGVKKVYPSSANFLLIKVDEPVNLYNYLLQQGIVVRDRSNMPLCSGCLRITIGREHENEILTEEIQNFFAEAKPGQQKAQQQPQPQQQPQQPQQPQQQDHSSRTRRRTRETDILADISLHGRGIADIQTGNGFLDHMLELFTFHSKTDLLIRASGDTHIDIHHTMEDIAITLGKALNSALADRKGMNRYGFLMPMDESSATVSIDTGGRSMLVWDVPFRNQNVGGIPVSMFSHFFRSLADNAGFTINISAAGNDDHHLIEAVFKGFARSLKQAVQITDNRIQSTKA